MWLSDSSGKILEGSREESVRQAFLLHKLIDANNKRWLVPPLFSLPRL
jgi:hypothetical protein